MLRLTFLDSPFAGRVCELTAEKTPIGRGESNALVIDHPSVSRTHCEILLWGMEIIIRDLGSQNGTCLNGVRLRKQQAPTKSGAIVEFGAVKARLELDVPASSDTVTESTAVHAYLRYQRAQQANAGKPKAPTGPVRLQAAVAVNPGVTASVGSLLKAPPSSKEIPIAHRDAPGPK